MEPNINARIAELAISIRDEHLLPENISKELDDLIQLVGQTNIVPARTPIVCHKCKRTDAPMYLLKRSGGKYIAICRDTDGGCWKHEAPQTCDWQDHMGVPCDMAAEWRVLYGEDKLQGANSCILHIGTFLTDIETHTITRLD